MSFLPYLSYDFDFAKAVVDGIQRDAGPYTVGRTVGPAHRRNPVFALHRPEKRAGCFLPAAGIGPPEGRRIRSDAADLPQGKPCGFPDKSNSNSY